MHRLRKAAALIQLSAGFPIHSKTCASVCTTVLPIAKIMVEIKEELVAPQQEEYKDRYIVCRDCGRKFLFSAGAQKHYDKMGWDDPKRCKSCRSYRNTRYLMCSSF